MIIVKVPVPVPVKVNVKVIVKVIVPVRLVPVKQICVTLITQIKKLLP